MRVLGKMIFAWLFYLFQNQGGRFDKYTPKTREDDPITREDEELMDKLITSIWGGFRRDKNRWKTDGGGFPRVLVVSKTETTRKSYEPKQLLIYVALY